MVAGFHRYFLAFLLWGTFLLSGCDNDVLGLLYVSSDLDERWQARNTFNFLSAADRNITLEDTYSFIMLADTHIINGNAGKLEKLKDVIDGDVKFVVLNGDITQSGKREDIETFIQIAGSLGVPCYPVV